MEIVTDLTTHRPAAGRLDAEKRAATWAKNASNNSASTKFGRKTFRWRMVGSAAWNERKSSVHRRNRLSVTALGGSVGNAAGGIAAEIALFKTYDALLAAPVDSLTGKIAVVTEPMVRTQDGSGYRSATNIRSRGPAEAARRGAVAYLLRSLATDSRRSPTPATRISR